MNKAQFLQQLEKELRGLPLHEIVDIMEDYESHFEFAAEEGKSEEEVTQGLGEPTQLGRELKANYHIEQVEEKGDARSIGRAIFATGAIGLFNFMFVLAPAVALYSFLIALWAMAITLVSAPVVFLGAVAFRVDTFGFLELFLSLMMAGAGLFGVVIMKRISMWVVGLTLKYLKFNLKLIRGDK